MPITAPCESALFRQKLVITTGHRGQFHLQSFVGQTRKGLTGSSVSLKNDMHECRIDDARQTVTRHETWR